MKISFDLDDTLICLDAGTPREINRVPWFLRRWLNEPLRKGTVDLLQQLAGEGHEIGIYTTSYRSKRFIKWLFRCYGLDLAFIINQHDHEQAFQGSAGRVASKMPHRFGIHIHVDDDEYLTQASSKYRFHVIQIDPSDIDWCVKIRAAIFSYSTCQKQLR